VADIFSAEKRSQIMSKIRSSGTKPELRLCEMAQALLGRRWRIDQNVRDLPGQPDVVIPALRMALFADGCFYHCCPKHGHMPKSRREYWVPKLANNLKRDTLNERYLRRKGYSVRRFWEHDLKGTRINVTVARLARILLRRRQKSGRPRTLGSA